MVGCTIFNASLLNIFCIIYTPRHATEGFSSVPGLDFPMSLFMVLISNVCMQTECLIFVWSGYRSCLTKPNEQY